MSITIRLPKWRYIMEKNRISFNNKLYGNVVT